MTFITHLTRVGFDFMNAAVNSAICGRTFSHSMFEADPLISLMNWTAASARLRMVATMVGPWVFTMVMNSVKPLVLDRPPAQRANPAVILSRPPKTTWENGANATSRDATPWMM